MTKASRGPVKRGGRGGSGRGGRGRGGSGRGVSSRGGKIRGGGSSSQYQSFINPWQNDFSMRGGMNSSFMGNNMGPSSFMGNNLGTDTYVDDPNMNSPMGFFNDRMPGDGLLPAPQNNPFMGPNPISFSPPMRPQTSNVQQRLGSQWRPPIKRGSFIGSARGGGYYPKFSAGNNAPRKFLKTQRTKPQQNKQSNKNGAKSKGSSQSNVKDSKSDDSSNTQPESESTKSAEETEEKANENKGEKIFVTPKEYPVEALYCHICDIRGFKTKDGYVRHIQSKAHVKVAEIFHAKKAALLEYMNLSAKLSEVRLRDYKGKQNNKSPFPKTIERVLANKMMHIYNCCGLKFSSLYELEEHRLTPMHHKTAHLKKAASHAKTEGCEEMTEQTPETDGDNFWETFQRNVEAAKEEEARAPLSTDNVEPYDPSSQFGLQFVKKVQMLECGVCRGLKGLKGMLLHCQSHLHYEKVLEFLDKKRKDLKSEGETKSLNGDNEMEPEAKRIKLNELEKNKIESPNKKGEEDLAEASDGEDMNRDEDDDVIALGEDEERILNADDEGGARVSGDEDVEEAFVSGLFEEIGDNLGVDLD